MIQKSIYYKQIRNIRLASFNLKAIKHHLDDNCNVKAIAMTEKQFENIKILSGNKLNIEKESLLII